MSDLATLYRASAHALPMVETGSVQSVITSPPYFGLRKYDGEQDIEWPTVTYAPIAGMAAITVQGCKPDCEHEWAHTTPVQVGRNDGGRDIGGRGGNYKGDGPHKSATGGAYCQKCGGWRGPLGNEPTLEAYIAHLILCAREWKRCLHSTGTLFVNLGDSYSGSGKGGNPEGSKWKGFVGSAQREKAATVEGKRDYGLRPKSLMMVPARFALAMQADGWILRSEMVWAKPNPMPESVTDRPTKAHEMIYLFSKQERYFWDADAVREPLQDKPHFRFGNKDAAARNVTTLTGNMKVDAPDNATYNGRNMRTVLTVATQPYSQAHFAVWPVALVEPMIKAGSRAGDTVLDPFSGSGTTGRVAVALGRRYIGIDLAAEYLDTLAPERLTVQMEMI